MLLRLTRAHVAALATLATVGVAARSTAQTAGTTASPTRAATLLARGDSAWDEGRADVALASYREVLALDSTLSSRAAFRLATLLARRNELDESLTRFREYVRLEPSDEEGRVALARTLAWAARYDESVALYDSVLGRDPTYRDAALGAAQTLAWAGRTAASERRYASWLAAHPDDVEAGLAFARVLSWAGKLHEAESRYTHLVAETRSVEAEKGVARVVAWRGELARSERLWRGLAARAPSDPEVWVGLAQVVRWRGRPGDAATALERALAIDPAHGDARTQLRWVDAELSPAAASSIDHSYDSDRNRSTSISLEMGARGPWNGRSTLAVRARDAELPLGATATRGRSLTAAVRASGSPSERLTLNAEAGLARLVGDAVTAGVPSAPSTAATRAVLALRARLHPTSALSVGAGVAHAPFDETATLIERALVTTSYDADMSISLPQRMRLSGGLSHTDITRGTVPNSRRAASGAFQWRPHRALSLGAAARSFGYDTTLADGYFSPEQFSLYEGNAGVNLGRELGWSLSADGGLGSQRVKAHGETNVRLAERISASLVYRPAPGTEWGASIGYANVASPHTITADRYWAYSLSLRGRLKF